jgi:hypothetical protein
LVDGRLRQHGRSGGFDGDLLQRRRDADANTVGKRYCDCYGNGNCNSDCDRYHNRESNGNADPNGNSDCDRYDNCESNRNAHGHA